MFDGFVDAIVNRLAPILTAIGDSVCARTPGLVAQWPAYEFMCRSTDTLGEMTVQHILVTVISMAIAILLGVVIGVRVSSSPWPQRGSLWYWPVLGLVLAYLVVGVVGLVVAPEEVTEVEQFRPSNVGTWGLLLAQAEGGGLMNVLTLIQAAILIVLGALFVAGVLPVESDLRLLIAGLVGALAGPLVIPRPFLHIILLQVYRGFALLPLGDALGAVADILNSARDAAPLWALILFVSMITRLPKRITWRTVVAAALGGYAFASVLSVFVVRPWTQTPSAVIQLVLFALLALVLLLGERAADPTLYVVGVAFTIPSLALFGIMIPIIGIGVDPAVAALVLYGLLPILRNTITALRELDPAYSEAGRGMGMTDLQLLTRVQLPLALPVILAGVRVSTVMTVGIASIATLVGAGGLGDLIFQGINRTNAKMVLTGAIWIALLALAFDFFFGQGEQRIVSKGIRPEKGETTVQDIQEAAGI